MPEAQTVENTPESIFMPANKGADRLSQIAAKYLSKGSSESPAPTTPETPPPTPVEVPSETTPPAEVTPPESPPLDTPATEPAKVEVKEDSGELAKKRSLIRRENQLRKKFESVKAYESEREAFEEYKKNAPRLAKLDKIERLAVEAPDKAVEELQIGLDRLSQAYINKKGEPKTEESMRLEKALSEVDEIKKKLQDKEESEARENNQRLIGSFYQQTKDEVLKDVDKYELTVLNNQLEIATDYRAQQTLSRREVPSVEESIGKFEKAFETNWLPSFLDKSKKAKAYLVSKGWTPPQSKDVPKPVVSQSIPKEPRTLSTELTTGSSPKPAKRIADRDERLAQLLKEHKLA